MLVTDVRLKSGVHSVIYVLHLFHATGKEGDLLPVEELLVPRRSHADRSASKTTIPAAHVGSAMKIGNTVRNTPLLKKTSGTASLLYILSGSENLLSHSIALYLS